MKTKLRILIMLLLCMTICLCLGVEAFAETVASGSCGDNVAWSLDDEGTLTISGTGAMADYAKPSDAPYADEDVYAVTVEEGVTGIGKNAFAGMFLDNVCLPESLTGIGVNAFYGAAITQAHFAGNLKQWNDNVAVADGNAPLLDNIQMDQDVTFDGVGLHLANGVLLIDHDGWGDTPHPGFGTSYVVTDTFRTEYGPYTFSVEFAEGTTGIDAWAVGKMPMVTKVTIPDTVISIGYAAFCECTELKSVTIPDSVTSIGDHAFNTCSGLKNVAIPDSVISIGEYAFAGCSGLTSLTIPDSVTNIGQEAFSGCIGLMSVVIPDSVTSISQATFVGCRSLLSVTIPNSVTSIGFQAFGFCNSLESLIIPDSVTRIEGDAFWECTSLTNIVIPNSVTSIGGRAFTYCESLSSITIPDSITTIEDSTFWSCTGLKSLSFGSSVTNIADSAFCGCDSLTNIYYDGTASMWNTINIGNNNEKLTSANIHYLPVDGGDTGDCCWLFYDGGLLKIIGMGSMADYPEDAAPWYNYSNQITTLTVCKDVTNLGDYAFSGLTGLESVTGMEIVTSFGDGAFKNCSALASLRIPTSVTTIGDGAFNNCSALEGLSIPATVTSMGQNAFSGCALLTSAGPAGSSAAIEFGWMKAIPANAFSGADCLQTLTIPEGVTRIMASAAENCAALSSVSLPSTLIAIQQNAFSGCEALAEITLPNGVTSVGAGAFRNCAALAGLSLPASVTTMGQNVFSGCALLTSAGPAGSGEAIEFGWTEAIPTNAFSGADFLQMLVIPEDMTLLMASAVKNCTALNTVSLPTTLTAIQQSAFSGCVSLRMITLPEGLKSIGAGAFQNAGLTDAFYFALASQWSSVSIDDGNDVLLRAIHCADCIFPKDLTTIGEEAFTGGRFTFAVLPESIAAIRKNAFADCSNLAYIYIPAKTTEINAETFGNMQGLTIIGKAGSTAETYAQAHSFTFIAIS